MAESRKAKGEVPLPKAGKGAFLRFDMGSLEYLEENLGEDFFDRILQGLSKPLPSLYKACLEAGLREAEIEGWPWGMPLTDLQDAILDALFLTVYGQTVAEKQAEDEKKLAEQIKEAEENPTKAALLYSRLFGNTDMQPGSDPTSSAASPSTKSSNSPAPDSNTSTKPA